jgi:hypothetical protein
MKPTVGTRVMSEGKTGTVTAHRPGEMVDVRWDGRGYDMRTDYKALTAVRENSGGKFKPVFVAAVLDDEAKQEIYNYWMSQAGAPRPLPVPKMSHMTIKFRPSPEEVASMPIGQPVQLRLVGWAANAQIQAVAVEPVGVSSANAAPHVTFAMADASVAPKLSNDLFAGAATSGSAAPGPTITARLGWSDGGTYHFSIPGTSANPGPRGGLTKGERNRLPDTAFALSGRRFPINDRRHAVIAMQYILRGFVGRGDAPKVLAAIAAKYPKSDRRNAEIWAFYQEHRPRLEARRNGAEDAVVSGTVRLGRLAVGLIALAGSSAVETIAKGTPEEQRERLKRLLKKFHSIAPETIDGVLADPNAFEFVLDFLKDHRAKVHGFIGVAGASAAALVKNPAEDTYDPAKEQFRAVVQGVYESQVRKELGLPYNAPFESGGRRLDAPLDEETKRQLLSSAYAIATRQGQKYGYLEPGTQTPTAKGRARAAERLSEQEHAGENRQDYERTLAAVRKSGHYRVVEERTDSNRRVFVVRPRPPASLIKIPEYRLTQAAAEQDATAAEAALSKAPKAVRLKANPFYVTDTGYTLTATDIEDGPEELTPLPGETFQAFEERIGVPSESLTLLGEWRGKVDPGDWLSPIPEPLRKTKLTKQRIIEDFERHQHVADGSGTLAQAQKARFEGKPLPPVPVKPGAANYASTRAGFYVDVSPGETLADLMAKGTPKDKLDLVKEAMADNVMEHFRFGLFALPPIREVYYTEPLSSEYVNEDAYETREYNRYEQGESIYTHRGWVDRFRNDFLEGLRAFISLLSRGTMPEGLEAMGSRFVFQTGEPEPYNPAPLADLAKLPPPAGEPAVEAIAKHGKNYLAENLQRLRVPRGLERMLFISPSALRLGVAADITGVVRLHNALVALYARLKGAESADVESMSSRPPVKSLSEQQQEKKDKAAAASLGVKYVDTSKMLTSSYFPAWTSGSEAALPPKLLGEYRGELQADERRRKSPEIYAAREAIAKSTPGASDDLPARYEAGDTPEMRYRAYRAVPPMKQGMDYLGSMQADIAIREGQRMLRDAELLDKSAEADRLTLKPEETEKLEAIEEMKATAAEMRARGFERLQRGGQLRGQSSITLDSTLRLWQAVPALAKRVFNDVVAASNQAAWHFNFYRVALEKKGLSADYIGQTEELADGTLRCFLTNGQMAVKAKSASPRVTYKFNLREERDSFVNQFLRPKHESKFAKEEALRELTRAEAELSFQLKNNGDRLEQAAIRADEALAAFRRELPPLDEAENFDWEAEVIKNHAAQVQEREAFNATLPASSRLPAIAPLTLEVFQREVQRRKDDWEKFISDAKRERVIQQYAPVARNLAALRQQAQDRLGGVQMSQNERKAAVEDLVKRIKSAQALYDRQYANEKAQGKHEAKVRGLSADRKTLPSDESAKKTRALRDALSAIDPTHPEASAQEDRNSLEAEELARRGFDRPVLPAISEAAIVRASGGLPKFKHGFYAPRSSPLDPPEGVWVPGRYVTQDDRELALPPSDLSNLEKFLDRVERGVMAQERREAEGLPYVLSVVPAALIQRGVAATEGLYVQCGPVALNSAETIPVLLQDSKGAIPGVKYDAVFADMPSFVSAREDTNRYPDSVLAFTYLINSTDRNTPIYHRLRRAFGSPAVQEITRQQFSVGPASKAKKLKEGFDAFVSRQAVNFRFSRPQDALALGKSDAAKKFNVDNRGFPAATYLYAGIPLSEARTYAADPSAPPPVFNGPIIERATLASKLFNSHRELMKKYPRLPGTDSLHRKEDGSPFPYVMAFPATAASKKDFAESAKFTWISGESIRMGEYGRSVAELTQRPEGWMPAYRDERKHPSEYARTWSHASRMMDLFRDSRSDIDRAIYSDAAARATAEEERRSAAESEEIFRRKSEAEKNDEIANILNEGARAERLAGEDHANDVVTKNSLLGKADAVDVLAGHAGGLRLNWFETVAGLRVLLRNKPEYEEKLAELEELANTGTAEQLNAALIDFTSSLPTLPPKLKGDITDKVRGLQNVVSAARYNVEQIDVPYLLQASATRVGKKAKSVPARRAQTMNVLEENMPKVFWDVEYDSFDAENPEVYVLYIDPTRYRKPEHAKTLSGDLIRRDLPTRMVRSKGGVGGGLSTAGLYGQTSEVAALEDQVARAQASGDREAEKAARAELRRINRASKDFRDAGRLYVSDLTVVGYSNGLDAVKKRLAKFSAPTAATSEEITEGQKALYRAAAQRTGQTFEDIIADVRRKAQEARAASSIVSRGDVVTDKNTGWVFDPWFGRIAKSANKMWDPDGGKFQKFRFSIANYARFTTKNPQVLLATIRYWDAPQLVSGTTLYLPGGRFITLPSVFDDSMGDSGYALPSDPSAMLTELIEEYKGHYLDALRAGDTVAAAEIQKILLGNESGEGLTDEEKDTEGLVNLAAKFHSATGYTIPGRDEVPAVSGFINGRGRFSIETGQPVGLKGPSYEREVKRISMADTRIGQLMKADVELSLAEGRDLREQMKLERLQKKGLKAASLHRGITASEAEAADAFVQAESEMMAQEPKAAFVEQPPLPIEVGMRVRMVGGRYLGAEGFVSGIEPGPGRSKNIVVLVDPYKNRLTPFEVVVNSLAASSLEIIDAGASPAAAEAEARRPSAAETRKGEAERTAGRRSKSAHKYSVGQRVVLNVDDASYFVDIDARTGTNEEGTPTYTVTVRTDIEGEDMMDEDGNPIVFDITEDEIISALGEGVGDYEGDEDIVVENPRARQRTQRPRKNGTLRARTYNAARLMPLVFE